MDNKMIAQSYCLKLKLILVKSVRIKAM